MTVLLLIISLMRTWNDTRGTVNSRIGSPADLGDLTVSFHSRSTRRRTWRPSSVPSRVGVPFRDHNSVEPFQTLKLTPLTMCYVCT